SQYVNMLRDLAIHFPQVREQFERANKVLSDRFPLPLSEYIFPPPPQDEAAEQNCREALTQTHVAQPALAVAEHALHQFIRQFGIKPDMVAGHSFGEYVALCAAKVFDELTLYRVAEARGNCIRSFASGNGLGTMAAVQASRETVAEALRSSTEVWIANINSPRQTVVSGSQERLESVRKHFEARGIAVRPVAVSCAFHSPLVSPARNRFAEFLASIEFKSPELSVFSNTTANPYPPDP